MQFLISLSHRAARWGRLVLCVALLFAAASVFGQKVDLNANGLSDIWEVLYGVAPADPEGDLDTDGVVNKIEAAAGTNPLDSNSMPSLVVSPGATSISIGMAGEPGKRYELQSLAYSTEGELSGNWVTEASMVLELGEPLVFSVPILQASRLFRMAIADVDSDGDGVNDWEELKLGLDPKNPRSNGQLAFDGHVLSDLEFVSANILVQNVFTIVAEDPSADQPDPGGTPINYGALSVRRSGFALNSVTVLLGIVPVSPGGAVEGIDYAPLSRSLRFGPGISAQRITIAPLANRSAQGASVATVGLLAGTGYLVGTASNASVVIYPSATPAGSGVIAEYYTNASATYSSSANFNPTNLVLTRIDPTISFNWSNGSILPISNRGYYSVRWTGQVQPQYSEVYYFVANSDDGVKLWINDQLIVDRWVLRGAADVVASVLLRGGVRYNLRMEYFNGGGSGSASLYWYSASQPKQIIPSARLYPGASGSAAAVTSPSSAIAFIGQPFSFLVTGANTPASYGAQGLPPGLGFDPVAGLISGTPSVAGDFQITLSVSNAAGLEASLLNLRVLDTGSSVVREVWLSAPGTNVADIPLQRQPDTVAPLAGLEGSPISGGNYGERIRGYFTAPVTGNYYFWLAGSDAAEFWLSNDSEPCNLVRRAWADAPTAPRQWSGQPGQQSAWLSLVAGQPYYLELLHKAGAGTNDHWSVAWRPDDTGTNVQPAGLVPEYLLSRYYPRPATSIPGTLYTAEVLAVPSATSLGFGSASLRLSPDGAYAILRFQVNNLTSPITGEHIHCDPYLNQPGQILFDIDAAIPQRDGSYRWDIGAVGTLSQADILEILRQGKAYINVHTGKNPAGEISGHFTFASGASSFTAPPPAPSWVDDHSNSNSAARFLIQATFGPTPQQVAVVSASGYENWIDAQFAMSATHHLPYVLNNLSADPTTPYPSSRIYNAWWQQSVTGPDQLRQRVAFALSEIFVVSDVGVLNNNARAVSAYYDTLLDNAFGNVRDLLEAVTLTPAMGLYLDMRRNDKGDIVTGVHPNENYAREILQLFSIGLNRLWPDGTPVIDSQGNLVPTYNQGVIMGFAAVFTGWNYYQTNQASGRLPTTFNPPANYTNAMVLVPTHHDLGSKLLLENAALPPAWGTQRDATNPDFDSYCGQDLELAMDAICGHQNIGPFLCRQLIQRLVTSSPSRDYVYRVVQKFNNNGAGVRGDLRAVIKAILLDYEARSLSVASQPTFGKQREPLLRATALARAFPAPVPLLAIYGQTNSRTILVRSLNPHRLNSGDTVLLDWSDVSGQPAPTAQGYSVTVLSPTQFSVNAPGLLSGTYVQTNTAITNMISGSLETTNVILATVSGHGLVPGAGAYLAFTSGGATNGSYQVIWTNGPQFAVESSDLNTNSSSGACLLLRLTAGGYTQSGTNIIISLTGPHGLIPGNPVYLNFTSGTASDGVYAVSSVPDAKHFTVVAASAASQTQNGVSVYPLVAPPLNRSGEATVSFGTWNIGATDANLAQTPLHSATVFNFYFPDYRFPGALAAAGLTTPEFQLSSDTETAVQMNFMQGGLLNNTGNTNGLSSFVGGNGAVVLDLGPYMTSGWTSNAGVPGLVDALSSLLTGGQVSAAARSFVNNYVANSTNFPYGTPPSNTQMRDRVRAVVHQIACSPDFIIQR